MAARGTFKIELTTNIKELADALEVDVGVVKRKIALDLYADIQRKTPVDTGRARNTWGVGDSPVHKPGVGAISKGMNPTYISNNLPYITRLEFGYSKQAPHGMVRIALASMEAKLSALRQRLP